MNSVIALVVVLAGSGSGFRLDSRVPLQQRVPNTCVTQSGGSCVFPFKYKVTRCSLNYLTCQDRLTIVHFTTGN